MDDNHMNQNPAPVIETAQGEAQVAVDRAAARKKKILKELREWVVALGVAVVIVLIINCFLFRLIRVQGSSLYSTLENGERQCVSRQYAPAIKQKLMPMRRS